MLQFSTEQDRNGKADGTFLFFILITVNCVYSARHVYLLVMSAG